MRMAPVKYDTLRLGGGLDQITPVLFAAPGTVRDGVNYECATVGGYTRVAGYERYDGRAAPSDAVVYLLQFATPFVPASPYQAGYTVGLQVSGLTSLSTARICATHFTNGLADYIMVTARSAAFTIGETLDLPGTDTAVYATQTLSTTSEENAQYLDAAAGYYRSLISAPSGSGAIRGVFSHNDVTYCLRDDAGGTAGALWKASGTGWTAVTLLNEVSFTVGAVATPADGATLTQGGVTATVRRVVTQTGAWTGSATGRLIISNPSGGNFAAGAATLTGGATCTLAGVQTAITISPGGRLESVKDNFFGQASTIRVYGATGVNRSFEFDNAGGVDLYVPLSTGLSTDTPKYIAAHQNHLMWTKDGSLIYSAPGDPYRVSVTDLGGQIAVGDTITGTVTQPGAQTTGALGILGRNSIRILYGTDSTTWNLTSFNTGGAGGLDYTSQTLAQSYSLDDRGVVTLKTTLDYGNFDQATLTNNVKPFLEQRKAATPVSVINRTKSQYRLLWSDGWGLYLTIVNGQYLGCIPVIFPNAANCTFNGEDSSGNELIFFGGANGTVYQMEKGTSFDGASIGAYATLNWAPQGNSRILKRYRHASLQVQSDFYAEIRFGYRLGYGSNAITQAQPTTYSIGFAGVPNWDSMVWDSFFWDGSNLENTEIDMVGTAENVSVTISSDETYIAPYNINSIILQYSIRRGLR